MDIRRLRSETREDHEAAEASFPLMRMGLDQAEYVSCLQRLHAVVHAWEETCAQAADNAPPGWLQGVVEKRRRAPMLERDLAHFGVLKADLGRPVMPAMQGLSSLLGSMYVMEGSTLGGQLIARHVDHALGLVNGQGSTYFHGHGERTGTMWKEFCGVLETQIPDAEGDAAIAAAKAMFQTFGAWMQGNQR